MGYQHGPIKTVCPKCGTIWFWNRRDWARTYDRPKSTHCNCGADLMTKVLILGRQFRQLSTLVRTTRCN